MLIEVRRLAEHAAWADKVLLGALQAIADVPPDAIREFGHVLGAAEVWLARLERRPARVPVWPALTLPELDGVAGVVHGGYAEYLGALDDPAVDAAIRYTNSAGQSFETSVQDILMHVALHGQYHRGKINLILRQAGKPPAPIDYIAFVRGAPAATSADAGRHQGPNRVRGPE
jgi:uncharacterized damage-inducible protein DinB